MNELKPCPFCGESDIEIQKDKGCGKYQCWCNDCFCAGPLQLFQEEAVKYWNTRNSQESGQKECKGCDYLSGRHCKLSVNHCTRRAEDYHTKAIEE